MTPEEELELCKVCLSDAEGMYSLRMNDLRELRAKSEKAAAIARKWQSFGDSGARQFADELLEALR